MLRKRSQKTSRPIQCLLFVVQNGSADSSEASCDRRWELIKGFVLLPSAIAKNNPKICELFTKRCNIQLLSNNKCPTLQSAVEGDRVEIVELILLNEVEASTPNPETSSRLQFSIEMSNEDVVQRVFGRNAVISETQFSRGKILNAVDEENKSVIDHILSIRPHIRLRNPRNICLLYLAAIRDDKILSRMLLEHGFNVNVRSNGGITPLHLATQYKDLQVVQFLSEKGASVNARRKNGATCLYLAAEGGCLEIFKFLVSHGGSVSIGKYDGTVPLHAAAMNGHIEILKDLLQRGVDINTRIARGRMKGCTPLYLAAEKGHTAIVECLLNLGADVDLDVVRMLLKMGAKVDEVYAPIYGNKYTYNHRYPATSLLHAAVAQSSVSMVQLLIEHGANVNLNCQTKSLREMPLEVAVDKSNLELVQLLLKNRAVVRNDAIYKASVLSDADIMRTLLLNVGDTSAETLNSAFRCAVSKGNLEVVKELLSFGANVNFNHEKIEVVTPLEAAVEKSHLELVKFLLTNGAVVRSSTIIKASVVRTVEIMKTLLLNVVDITVETLNSALLHATHDDNLEIVKVLLKSGAVIDAAQSSGNGSSAVHLAAETGCDMIKFFIANNANLEIKDSSGRTPLFRALFRGHRAVVDTLLVFGASIDVLDDSRSVFSNIVLDCETDIFESLLEASFQAPSSIIHSNFWRIFDESYLKNYWYEPRKERSKFLKRHLIKMKAANLDVNDEKVILSWPLSEADDFRSDCESEVVCMKTLTIGDSSVTFFDILRKDVEQLASYMRNDTIYQMLKSEDFKTRFPIYASIIDWQIRKGTQRRLLLDEGLKICGHLFRNFLLLPLELRERIVKYLTDQNLLVLKYAFTGSLS